LKVVDDAETLQLAIDRFEIDAVMAAAGHQLHHRLNLQLEHLQPGHGVAVAAVAEALQLLGIEQGANHPLLIVEVVGQELGLLRHRQFQGLAGAEGQSHGSSAGAS